MITWRKLLSPAERDVIRPTYSGGGTGRKRLRGGFETVIFPPPPSTPSRRKGWWPDDAEGSPQGGGAGACMIPVPASPISVPCRYCCENCCCCCCCICAACVAAKYSPFKALVVNCPLLGTPATPVPEPARLESSWDSCVLEVGSRPSPPLRHNKKHRAERRRAWETEEVSRRRMQTKLRDYCCTR